MINESIAKLVKYGENAGLVSGLDKIYATNRILEVMQISDYEEPEQIPETPDLEETLNELLELNPNLSVTSSIYVGQEMTVKSNDPFITVQATVTVTEKETAEKEIEYQYDNTKSSSYKKIIQQGTNGVTEVKKEQLYINGIFDSENIVSSNVVTQPVKEIVCIGTN